MARRRKLRHPSLSAGHPFNRYAHRRRRRRILRQYRRISSSIRRRRWLAVRDAQNAVRAKHWRRIPRKKRAWISNKIRFLIMEEGYGQKQAIAIAMRMAGAPRKRRHGRKRR